MLKFDKSKYINVNFEKLYEIIKKYQTRYYHNQNNIYLSKTPKEYEIFTVELKNIVYDVLELNVNEDNIDFIWNNVISYDKNIINLMNYIYDLECDNQLELAFIHFAWFCIIKENHLIDYIIKNKYFENLYIRYGQTLVEWNIMDYKGQQEFKIMANNWDNIFSCIKNKYEKDLIEGR